MIIATASVVGYHRPVGIIVYAHRGLFGQVGHAKTNRTQCTRQQQIRPRSQVALSGHPPHLTMHICLEPAVEALHRFLEFELGYTDAAKPLS